MRASSSRPLLIMTLLLSMPILAYPSTLLYNHPHTSQARPPGPYSPPCRYLFCNITVPLNRPSAVPALPNDNQGRPACVLPPATKLELHSS